MLESLKEKLPQININKKFLFSFVIILFLLAGMGTSVYLVQQKQEIRKRASGETRATSIFSASVTEAKPGDTFTVDVNLNPASLEVSAASLFIKYPSDKLTLTQVTPGQFFMKNFPKALTSDHTSTEMLNKIDFTTSPGTAKIYLGAPCAVCSSADTCKPGQACCTCYPGNSIGVLATLNFQVKTGATGTATILLGNQAPDLSEVAAKGQTASVLDLSLVPSISINLIVPTTTPKTAGLNFKIKFQSFSNQKTDKVVTVTAKSGGNTTIFTDVPVTSDINGIYSGSIKNLPPGNYDIYIKGPIHLSKKFGPVTLTADDNASQDWSSFSLVTGDLNNDDIIEALDGSIILSKIRQYNFNQLPDNINEKADLNGDKYIEALDFSIFISNYFKQGDLYSQQ